MRLITIFLLFIFCGSWDVSAATQRKENTSIHLLLAENTAAKKDAFSPSITTPQSLKPEEVSKNQDVVSSSKFSKLVSILSLALISILSLLSLSLYRNNIIRKQTNALLQEKNSELLLAKEKAERASTARSEFLSTVSHELRTPLNAITGITHLLIEEEPKPSQIDYLNSLKFSGNYLLNYINEILEINRIESKNIEVEKIDFNLKELVTGIHHSMKEQAQNNNNKFVLEVDPDIPENLIGDPTKLSQIIINLVNNAIKFTEKGTVHVLIKLLKSENRKATVFFEVSDTGIGIPKDKQESVFESFSQGSIEINRKYGGTGLGLAIVRRLIIILGGSINLSSKIGQGTIFSFTLDFKEGMKQPAPCYDFNDSDFIAKKILLVEDNKINQMITRRLLEKKQMLCDIVETGEDAVSVTQKNRYDLILMDVHLPGINGTIATQQIREFDTTTPIIALTAISLLENREMLLSYGMNEVITKPFEPEKFFATIAEYIQKENPV
ncbi:ATP-binding protein [Flavobacterium sp.]|uniref:ATP-binding protein n=1 Tax=Flavobacterium sp. TaxID=239 RepID=UPI0034552264